MGHSLLIVLIVFIVFKPVPPVVCLTIDFWFKHNFGEFERKNNP